jgi:hypothetical protein
MIPLPEFRLFHIGIMMEFNFKNQLFSLGQLLGQYQNIWSPEVMNSYPESLNAYPQNWIEDLDKLDDESLWSIDTGRAFDKISNNELKDLFKRLKIIGQISSLEAPKVDFTQEDFFKMKEKKRHEVERIISFLKDRKDENPEVLDIGGGIGHLARVLSKKMGKAATIVEADPNFIRIGNEVNKKLNVKNISYVNDFFSKKESYHQCNSTLMTGLHACGDLTSDLIEYAAKNRLDNLLSLGCCYFKVKGKNYLFLSKVGRSLELKVPKYALTLASRSHTGQDRSDFNKKKKVKYYRYALHLYLYHKLGIRDFLEVGESKYSLYLNDFSYYARKKFDYLNIQPEEDDKQLNDFYSSSKTQKIIRKMFLANIIRWQFGRSLEKMIILDRALFLEESKYKVELGEIFDENISPRNIAIYAKKLTNK